MCKIKLPWIELGPSPRLLASSFFWWCWLLPPPPPLGGVFHPPLPSLGRCCFPPSSFFFFGWHCSFPSSFEAAFLLLLSVFIPPPWAGAALRPRRLTYRSVSFFHCFLMFVFFFSCHLSFSFSCSVSILVMFLSFHFSCFSSCFHCFILHFIFSSYFHYCYYFHVSFHFPSFRKTEQAEWKYARRTYPKSRAVGVSVSLWECARANLMRSLSRRSCGTCALPVLSQRPPNPPCLSSAPRISHRIPVSRIVSSREFCAGRDMLGLHCWRFNVDFGGFEPSCWLV